MSIPETMKEEIYADQAGLVQALRDSEARHRALISSLPVAVYTCNESGKINFFNDMAVQLWGYKPELHDDGLKFCACHKVFTLEGAYISPNQTPMAIALKTGQAFRNVEAVVERPDGSRFYANICIDPLFDEKGNITGAINIFQDISDWKKAEAELRESELKYKQLVETLPAAIYTTDAEGRITLYNKAAVQLWGREPEIGKDLWCGSWKILQPDGSDLPLEHCPMAITLKEGRPVWGEEIVVIKPDGTRRNVAPFPQPLFDSVGKLTGAVNMLVDITDRKKIERIVLDREQELRVLAIELERKIQEKTKDLLTKNEELKKSEERYHKMVAEVQDYAILLMNRDGIIQNWNVGAEKIKGYHETEIVGKHFRTFYLPEDRESGLPERLLQQAVDNGKAVHEGWRLRKDGTRFWGNIVITALHNSDNEVIGFSKVTRDLSERKISEDRIMQYATELEFQNKELEEFAYAASHDLKEPLRKIHFYNSFIADNCASQLDAKAKDYLDRSIGAVRRMRQLIEDILSYTKNTASQAAFEEVDLNEIAEDVARHHKDELVNDHVSIQIGKLPVVTGISFQLRQVMDNLISNSIKYRHPDRNCLITVTGQLVDAEKIPASFLDKAKRYYEIAVEDNGTGFDQRYEDKIFEIFQRLHSKTDTSGSGIGLAICKKILQNHKGFIHATGRLNEGARFAFYLPH